MKWLNFTRYVGPNIHVESKLLKILILEFDSKHLKLFTDLPIRLYRLLTSI